MTVERVGSDVLVVGSGPRRAGLAVLLGVSVAFGVLTAALLAAGLAGVELRASGSNEIAAAAIPTAIALVLPAFFCGGWAYSAKRSGERYS